MNINYWCEPATTGTGTGLRARRDIPAGTAIWRHDELSRGTIQLTGQQLAELPPDTREHFLTYCWQDDDELYSGCIGADTSGDLTNYINHSCDPNVWFTGLDLTARHTVRSGDELCIDYATCMTSYLHMVCGCGTATCRRIITSGDWIRYSYDGHVKPYIAKKIAAQSLINLQAMSVTALRAPVGVGMAPQWQGFLHPPGILGLSVPTSRG